MKQILETYLSYVKQNQSGSMHTHDAYNRDITRFIEFLQSEGITRFQDVDRFVIQNFIMKLRNGDLGNKGLSNRSLARNISSLRSFYQYLNQVFDYQVNPFMTVKTPKLPKKLPEMLFVDEIDTKVIIPKRNAILDFFYKIINIILKIKYPVCANLYVLIYAESLNPELSFSVISYISS